MPYLWSAGAAENYRNDVKAVRSAVYIVGCEEIAGGPGQFGFLGRRNSRFNRLETLAGPGLYLDKNDGSIGSDHNKVDFTGLTGEIAGQFLKPSLFQEFFAALFAPLRKQFSVG